MEKDVGLNPGIEVEKLIRNISLLSWFSITCYAILDYFNKSYFSSSILGVGGCFLFPLILLLNRFNKRTPARFFLIIGLDIFICVATDDDAI